MIGIIGTGGPVVLTALANLGELVRAVAPLAVPLLVLASLLISARRRR